MTQVPGVPGGFSDDDGWRWGGCSDNVNYGVWFTMMFVDASERSKIGRQHHQATAHQHNVVQGSLSSHVSSRSRGNNRRPVSDNIKALVNLHNNEVGRKVRTIRFPVKTGNVRTTPLCKTLNLVSTLALSLTLSLSFIPNP